MSPRRVLITGAGGFVGAALSTGFHRLGWDVVGVDRQFDDDDAGEGIARIRADLLQGVPPHLGPVDVVIHGAWLTTDPGALGVTPAEYAERNLRPLEALLEYAATAEPEAFVFLSSSGVFAATDGTSRPGSGLTDADRPTGTSPYAVAKRSGESLVARSVPHDTAAWVVRLGHLYGPREAARPSRQRLSLVQRWIAAASEGGPLPVRADDPARDWTFVPDLAPALARMVLGTPARGPLHLGSPFVVRDRVLASRIAAFFPGVDLELVPTSAAIKPPMIPSRIASLDGFGWTEPERGLETLLSRTAA